MKIIKITLQFALVMIFFYAGNMISDMIKPFILIPGSIIGMLLLFLALIFKVVKLEHVENTSNFFLKYMGFFFVPLGVGLMNTFGILKTIWWQLIIILVVSNIIVMGLTAKITEFLINRKERTI